ncbi:MAG: hypothetical protein CL484_13555 [Acidobacteria bacterium]|nr:hypothetical protein [Acidobacteriota bacterium]|tara:strand:+ start:12870 stop:15281 length:2412 start_codon:yes stop_codon:yes gene_type:complete
MLCGFRVPLLARGWVSLALFLTLGSSVQEASAGNENQRPSGRAPEIYIELLDRYCVACHNDRLRTGEISFDGISLEFGGDGSEVWEKVLRKLGTREMPPPGRPRPTEDIYREFAGWLEKELDAAAMVHPNPGRSTLHRLNRLEYANSIRDLLGLEIDAEALLPADDLAYGFDNNADILTVSPGLFERYMSAARKISRLAIGDPTIEADAVRYSMPPLQGQDERMSEELPFGSRGGTAIRHHFPLDGEYIIRIALKANRGRTEAQEVDVRVDGVRVALVRVGQWPGSLERESASGSEPVVLRTPVTAGTHVVSVSFAKRTAVPEGMAPAHLPIWTFSTGRGFVERMALENVQIEGPFAPDRTVGRQWGQSESVSRRKVFICRPTTAGDEAGCADKILRALARRAFRRALDEVDFQVLRSFYESGSRDGGFQGGIQRALEMILVDPEFLFRVEQDPVEIAPATAYRISDVELASRLSFFLWGSIPDEELLEVAIAGKLGDQQVLEQQVRRMLADDRSSVLVSSFAAQWLHLRRMKSVTPDVNAFPAFDDGLRNSLVRETELFLQSQVGGDRSVVDLLTADYTFVNERLARHYGIDGVYGSRFRRVVWEDERRKGLLGLGSILTVTSLATRTSPVVRGKWILENVLGSPPPPPPPDVPELPEQAETGSARSVRERLEEHRENPICASCHSRMDPLGFALENFDAVGKWRDRDAANTAIDVSGLLPDGTSFNGISGLREVLLGRRLEFVATVTEKLLIYALGRGVEFYDRPAIRTIVREAAGDDYRWSSIILGVVNSQPFQMRRSES